MSAPWLVGFGVVLGLTALVSTPFAAPGRPRAPDKSISGVEGMTVSCHGWGHVWGGPNMRYALRELKSLGVEWVAIHPYARIEKDGQVSFRPAARSGYLRRAVEITRSEGVELFWKPHLAYWGNFAWRGAIDFGTDEAKWRRFFRDYEAFIVDQATFAEVSKIKLLAVGLEYESTVHREKDWRQIIAAVRRVYGGRITYGSNWDGLDRVPFWDAVDLIGVQAYFPVANSERPTSADLRKGWGAIVTKLRALSKRNQDKPVLFTEIGYSRSLTAARTPWKPATDNRAPAKALRSALFDAAFETITREPLIRGAFWWKWMPGKELHHRDFSMKDEEARAALIRHWGDAE